MKPIHFICPVLAAIALSQPVNAVSTTPEAQDQLRIYPSVPKRNADSLFSYTVEWRVDAGLVSRSTGMTFLNAQKISGSNGAVVSKKIAVSLKDGMTQLEPKVRGIHIAQAAERPEITLSNKEGYSLTTVTVRDYSNQALRYEIPDKTFDVDGVQAAIDLVLTSEVEYLEGISASKAQTASTGSIDITLEGQEPIHITTDGKTTRELEEEIAAQISSSKLSETPIYPNLLGSDTRNFKQFDGSEVQLPELATKSITIDINDPNIGVLTKFQFRDLNYEVKVMEPRFMMMLIMLAGVAAGGFLLFKKLKKPRA